MRLLPLIGLLTSSTLFAASSGTLTLSGTVAAVNSVTVVPNSSNNLSIDIVNGQTAFNVASVTEWSNSLLGYKIQLSSLNSGELKSGSVVGTTYTLSYDGSIYSTPSTTPTNVRSVNSLTQLTSHTSPVLITVIANPNALAGTFTDTVTISIVAN